jgi:signal transduction histidine kinase
MEPSEDLLRGLPAGAPDAPHGRDSLAQLAGGVAHELNNLLGVILNYTTLLAESQTEPTAAADLAQIRAAAERGAALIRQLEDFARRDATRLDPRRGAEPAHLVQ